MKTNYVKFLEELIDFFVSSKLSMEACEELIEALAKEGICITFSKDLTPDINYLPQEFVPYDRPTPNEEYGPRTWRSSTTLGVWWSGGKRTDYEKSTWSQTTTSPLQSTPGAGLAYKAFKDKDGNTISNSSGLLKMQIINGIGGLTLTFGQITVSAVACALVLGILTNFLLSKAKEE